MVRASLRSLPSKEDSFVGYRLLGHSASASQAIGRQNNLMLIGRAVAWVVLVAAVALITFPSFAQTWSTEPDSDLTPGAIRNISLTKLCRTKWGSDARAVTASMKRAVMDAYQFDVSACP